MGKNFLLIIFVLTCFNIGYSQNLVGKIYSSYEATNLYGPVISSVSISKDQLSIINSKTVNYIMFRVFNGNLTILGDKRVPLYPPGIAQVDAKDVYRYFSKSLVEKLLNDGNTAITFIEERKDGIITITNGNYTMEVGVECPPWCD